MRKTLEVNTGDKYGMLTIIEEVQPYIKPNGKSERKVKCKCDCGNLTDVLLFQLRSGKTKSCGCYLKEVVSKIGKSTISLNRFIGNHSDETKNKIRTANTKHGLYKTSEYRAWDSMKQRCYNPNCRDYKDWGGRGITVCERWLESFENFIEDMGMKPSSNLSIDRINVNGNYELSNCRWTTASVQNSNQRKRVIK